MLLYTRWSIFRKSFQYKLFLIFSLLTLLIACIISTLYIVTERHQTLRVASEMVQLMANQLADSVRLPLYAENREELRQIIEHTAQAPEIKAVVITASDGRVLAESYPVGKSPGPSALSSTSTKLIIQTAEVQSSRLINSVESAITGSHDTYTAKIGSVRIERGTDDLSRAIHRTLLVTICIAIIFWVTVSWLCLLVLRKVTHSFNTLMKGIDVIQGGDFSSRINIEANDEPGRAAKAINNLAKALQLRNEENAHLEEERLQLESQILHSQKLESLGVMAGGIAHDFNNLLQAILGNIELAAMNVAPDSAPQKYLTNAVEAGRHATSLTSLMLTYVGKGIFVKNHLNLNSLVVENIDMLKAATSTSFSMKLSLSAEPAMIMADEAHIQQVIMNLIINAAESINVQPGLIQLSTGIQNYDQTFLDSSLLNEKQEPGCYVFLEVIDNGCGMDSETVKRIFDPFFSTKFTGRGLGMSAVMGIIRTHKGALFVKSEPNKGTTFTVLFPASESTLPASTHLPTTFSDEKDTIPEIPISGVILVVDDEKAVLKICKKMVELSGYRVITACDGSNAVSIYREHADEIDIVLMDLTMPNMDGITAMGEIYNIRHDAKVILCSGFNKHELSERITNFAPAGFIRKPYNMNLLRTEIQKVMATV